MESVRGEWNESVEGDANAESVRNEKECGRRESESESEKQVKRRARGEENGHMQWCGCDSITQIELFRKDKTQQLNIRMQTRTKTTTNNIQRN